MTLGQGLRFLRILGYLKSGKTNKAIKLAWKMFQKAYGLKPDGDPGRITLRAMQERMTNAVCGCPDVMAEQARVCKWPMNLMPLTYHLRTVPDILSMADWRDIFKDHLDEAWSDVCGVTFQYVDNVREANIVVISKRFDGPSGILADAQLPCGNQQQLTMRLDSAEKWSKNGRNRRLLAGNVVSHEGGHNLGLYHIENRRGVALLNAMYNSQIGLPQPLDIEQVVQRYGSPKSKPTPEPTPLPIPGEKFDPAELNIASWRYKGKEYKV